MNIGILSNTYPPNKNGVSFAVKSLSSSLEDAGHKVWLATPKIEGVNYPPNIFSFSAIDLPDNISTDLKLPWNYLQEVRDFFADYQVEIIHSHDTIMCGVQGSVLAMKLNVACVHTFHTMVEDYEYFSLPGYKKIVRNFLKNVLNTYDHIIAPSEKVYTYLLKLGIKHPLTKIPNITATRDLDSPIDKKVVDHLKKLIRYFESNFVFVTSSRLAPEKSIDKALVYLEPVLKNNPRARFLICGDGPSRGHLEKLILDFDLTGQVFLYGSYDRKELASLYSVCDCFVFTSTTENLPTTLWEACYLGLPVVSILDSCVNYILKNNYNSLIAKGADMTQSLEKILKEKALYNFLQSNTKLSTKALNQENILAQHLSLYKYLIQNHEEKENRELYSATFFEKQFSTIKKLYQKMIDNFQ